MRHISIAQILKQPAVKSIERLSIKRVRKVELKRLVYQNYHSALVLDGISRMKNKTTKTHSITQGIIGGVSVRSTRIKQIKEELRGLK